MARIGNRNYTPNQRRLKNADILLEKRLARLKRQGYIFNEGVRIPSHPKKITKKYLETYEKNIRPKELKKFATGKRSIINGEKVLESIAEYEKRMAERKIEKEKIDWSKEKFNTFDKTYEKTPPNNTRYTNMDFEPPLPTPFDETIDEDYIHYNSVIKSLKDASGNTPFAQYLLDVITDELPNLGLNRMQINIALSKMEEDGITLTRELLYEGEEVAQYLRELINRLPIDNKMKQEFTDIVDANEIFIDPEYENLKSWVAQRRKDNAEFKKKYRKNREGVYEER